jgi:hypothetical protein
MRGLRAGESRPLRSKRKRGENESVEGGEPHGTGTQECDLEQSIMNIWLIFLDVRPNGPHSTICCVFFSVSIFRALVSLSGETGQSMEGSFLDEQRALQFAKFSRPCDHMD